MNELLMARIRRNPPRTQDACCAIAARQVIAQFGPVAEEDIRHAARGLAAGLFGPAFEEACPDQANAWIDMCEREYRKAVGGA